MCVPAARGVALTLTLTLTLFWAAAMAALVFKVGTLFVRTLAKPLSNRFESYVMGHPKMRKRARTQTPCSCRP